MTIAWRNKSYHRRKFNKPVVQFKENISQGSAECSTLWTITKDENMDEQAITFTDKDAKRVHHSHDDAVVITLLIANYTTRRVLVDNGSSANILYYPAF